MNDLNGMNMGKLINTEYSLHQAKNCLRSVKAEVKRGMGKNTGKQNKH